MAFDEPRAGETQVPAWHKGHARETPRQSGSRQGRFLTLPNSGGACKRINKNSRRSRQEPPRTLSRPATSTTRWSRVWAMPARIPPSDIESTALYHGIHGRQFGCYRMLAHRFPFGIYYRETATRTSARRARSPTRPQLAPVGTRVAGLRKFRAHVAQASCLRVNRASVPGVRLQRNGAGAPLTRKQDACATSARLRKVCP